MTKSKYRRDYEYAFTLIRAIERIRLDVENIEIGHDASGVSIRMLKLKQDEFENWLSDLMIDNRMAWAAAWDSYRYRTWNVDRYVGRRWVAVKYGEKQAQRRLTIMYYKSGGYLDDIPF